MYFEFLFFRAHSRSRVERMYWSGASLNSLTTCSNSVMVGTTGPMGSGFPQFGLPRRFAIMEKFLSLLDDLRPDWERCFSCQWMNQLQSIVGQQHPKNCVRRPEPRRAGVSAL